MINEVLCPHCQNKFLVSTVKEESIHIEVVKPEHMPRQEVPQQVWTADELRKEHDRATKPRLNFFPQKPANAQYLNEIKQAVTQPQQMQPVRRLAPMVNPEPVQRDDSEDAICRSCGHPRDQHIAAFGLGAKFSGQKEQCMARLFDKQCKCKHYV